MNPYFQPLPKPDGGEWPALMERCPECRPTINGGWTLRFFQGQEGDDWRWDRGYGNIPRPVYPEVANLLARERAIAFLQKSNPEEDDNCLLLDVTGALVNGATDETYARLCHEVLDAREKPCPQ